MENLWKGVIIFAVIGGAIISFMAVMVALELDQFIIQQIDKTRYKYNTLEELCENKHEISKTFNERINAFDAKVNKMFPPGIRSDNFSAKGIYRANNVNQVIDGFLEEYSINPKLVVGISQLPNKCQESGY